MSDLRKKVEIERVRRLIFEMISEADGLYPDPNTLYTNKSYQDSKRLKSNNFDIGNLSRTSCSSTNIPDSLKRKINNINLGISSYISTVGKAIYEEEIKKDEKFDKEMSSASTAFFGTDNQNADSRIQSNYASASNLYINKIANNFKLEIKQDSSLGGGPCKNIYFQLTIPEILEGNPRKLEYFNTINKNLVKNGFDNALDFYIGKMEKSFGDVFDKNCDTVIQAWEKDSTAEYLGREIMGKSIDSPEFGVAELLDFVTGGSLTGANMESDLRKIGEKDGVKMSEKDIDGFMYIFYLEFTDFWTTIMTAFAGSSIGIGSWAALKELVALNPRSALSIFSRTVLSCLRAIGSFIFRYALPIVLIAFVVRSGIGIVNEAGVFSKLIQTYKSVIKKVLSSHFNKIKSLSGELSAEIKSNYTDYSVIYEKIFSSLDDSDIVAEIEKALSTYEDQDLSFSYGAAAYYSPFGTILRMVGDALLRATEVDKDEKEEIIREYEKISRKNGDFLREKDTSEILEFLNQEAALKSFDFNEWYNKSNETKEGNMFSQREAQFLNDVFLTSNVNVGQKAGKEKTGFLNTIIGSIPNAVKTMAAMSTMSAIVSMSIDSRVGHAGLENIDKMLKDIQLEAVSLKESENFLNLPLKLLYNIFESFDFSKDTLNIKIKKEIYQEMIDSWEIKNINMENYSSTTGRSDYLFPLIIKKIAIG